MKKILTIAILLISNSLAFAQGEFSLGVRGVIPTGEFRFKSDAWGLGVAANGLFNIGHDESWILLGGEFSYSMYGTSSRVFDVPIVSGFNRRFEVTTNNNMLMGHLVARIKPSYDGNIFPYCDGLFGFNYIYTNTNLTDLTINNNNTNNNTTQTRNQIDDWALSYGGAIGVQIGGGRLKFDMKCYYLLGTKARYYDGSSIQYTVNNNGSLDYYFKEPVYSATNVIIPQIGILVRF